METSQVAGLRLALELFESGARMMRQNLRRRFPTASSEEIDDRLDDWISCRPGAEDGDSPGHRVTELLDLS